MMLEEVLYAIKNDFAIRRECGTFTIRDGSIKVNWLLNGQYFRIIGSVLNDGIYRYPACELIDEEFTGQVVGLAIPPAVVRLAADVEEWHTKNPVSDKVSESFGGYSYTRGSVDGKVIGWNEVFADRINSFKKIGW